MSDTLSLRGVWGLMAGTANFTEDWSLEELVGLVTEADACCGTVRDKALSGGGDMISPRVSQELISLTFRLLLAASAEGCLLAGGLPAAARSMSVWLLELDERPSVWLLELDVRAGVVAFNLNEASLLIEPSSGSADSGSCWSSSSRSMLSNTSLPADSRILSAEESTAEESRSIDPAPGSSRESSIAGNLELSLWLSNKS